MYQGMAGCAALDVSETIQITSSEIVVSMFELPER